MSDVRTDTPWPGPLPGSVEAGAVRADVCWREDHDAAQATAALRARFRGVRQRIELRWSRMGRMWCVRDDRDLLGRPR